MIVKYLTSSKLTRLQLRDAAFRRTLLVQCLVLLHACAHPKHAVNKAPLRQLREKQASLLYAGILLHVADRLFPHFDTHSIICCAHQMYGCVYYASMHNIVICVLLQNGRT